MHCSLNPRDRVALEPLGAKEEGGGLRAQAYNRGRPGLIKWPFVEIGHRWEKLSNAAVAIVVGVVHRSFDGLCSGDVVAQGGAAAGKAHGSPLAGQYSLLSAPLSSPLLFPSGTPLSTLFCRTSSFDASS